jgi:hypothetical protein
MTEARQSKVPEFGIVLTCLSILLGLVLPWAGANIAHYGTIPGGEGAVMLWGLAAVSAATVGYLSGYVALHLLSREAGSCWVAGTFVALTIHAMVGTVGCAFLAFLALALGPD